MELLRQCFAEYHGALTTRLTNAGFTIDQARLFLPMASTSIIQAAEKSSLFQTIASLMSGSPHQLVKKIDVYTLAQNSGINSVKVTTGLNAIAPILLQALASKKRHAA